MREQAISEVIRVAREEAGININELAVMAGVEHRLVGKLESDCSAVPIWVLAVVVDALDLRMSFQKPLDDDTVDFLDSLNVREYDTVDDFCSAREWAQNAYRMAIADAAMRADLREAY